MQSSKPLKKKRNIAGEKAASTPEVSVDLEATMKPRSSTSSKKKIDTGVDAGTGKTHRKLSAPVSVEISRQESMPVEPVTLKTAAAVAGVEQAFQIREISPDQIAKLAHSYWVERGYAHGHSEADWLRAEQDLKSTLNK